MVLVKSNKWYSFYGIVMTGESSGFVFLLCYCQKTLCKPWSKKYWAELVKSLIFCTGELCLAEILYSLSSLNDSHSCNPYLYAHIFLASRHFYLSNIQENSWALTIMSYNSVHYTLKVTLWICSITSWQHLTADRPRSTPIRRTKGKTPPAREEQPTISTTYALPGRTNTTHH